MKQHSAFEEQGNLAELTTLCVWAWGCWSDNQRQNHSPFRAGKTLVSSAFQKDYSGSHDCVLRNTALNKLFEIYIYIHPCVSQSIYIFSLLSLSNEVANLLKYINLMLLFPCISKAS